LDDDERTTIRLIKINIKMDCPSILRQKQFIIEGSNFLSLENKNNIISIVMLDTANVFLKSNNEQEVNINLDKLNEDVLNKIYNIVKARLEILHKPLV